tara:strand:+ start:219 stop:410 length:192 start_codon:yes stop_codon:yes gene_type:complete
MAISDTEKTNLQNTYSGIELKYGEVNGFIIESGDVYVKYNNVENIVKDTFSAVESFCNDVNGG